MSRLRILVARLIGALRSTQTASEFDDEVRDHIERSAADHRARGLTPAEALAAARAEFGSIPLARDAHADAARSAAFEHLVRDIRFALRGWRRSPLFIAVIVSSLALSIGATSAVFAIVNAVVFRPLPYADSDRLVHVGEFNVTSGQTSGLSPPDFFDVRERARTLAAVAGYWTPTMRVSSSGGTPERVLGTACTANFLRVLGVAPAIGRGFVDADDAQGAPRVAVLSHRLWRRAFGGDPTIVGRRILIDDTAAVVIGVMPDRFDFPLQAELWTPIRLSRTEPPNRAIPPERYRQYRILTVVGRLSPDVTLAQARDDLRTIFNELERANPKTNRQMTATADLLHTVIVGDVRPAMLLMLAAAGCLLLIATANIATLLTVRGESRERDLTMRLALGATTGRLAQQLLIESVLVGLAGSATGLAVAYALLGVLLRFAPPGIPRLSTAGIDATVMGFTAAVGIACGILFGVAPAFQSGRRRLLDALKSGSRTTSSRAARRLRDGLVIAEVSLAMLLLVTAGLLTRTLVGLGRVELGFRSAGVYTFDRIELERGVTPLASAAFFERLLEKLRASPGVDAAGLTIGLPLDPKGRFLIDESAVAIDREPAAGDERQTARMQVVTDGYFEALRVPLLAGRSFGDGDSPESVAVVIVNKTFADRYFPDGHALGHSLTHELSIVPGQPTRRLIVGIVGDVRQFNLNEPYAAQFFVPHTQMPWPALALVVRTPLGLPETASTVRSSIRELAPGVAMPPGLTLEQAQSDALGQPRLRAWLIGLFAAVALILAGIGLYGTIAFAVQRRQGELALRVILGATPRRVALLVVRDGLALAVLGTIAGAAAAYPSTRLISALLFGVNPFDLGTVTIVAGVLWGVAAAASYLPARRVFRLDPVSIVHSE
jgi:putative ABC transport system permease protein